MRRGSPSDRPVSPRQDALARGKPAPAHRSPPDTLEERSLTPIIVLIGVILALIFFRNAALDLTLGGPASGADSPTAR